MRSRGTLASSSRSNANRIGHQNGFAGAASLPRGGAWNDVPADEFAVD
jgi:hypothetical protein